MTITNDIKYVGVNDHQVDLFEGQYVVPNGMAYNSYVILDEKVAVMDTVDKNFTAPWMENLTNALEGRDDMQLTVCGNEDRILLVARFDNLGKGASGAAIQNMNLVLGVPEDTGLNA